LANQLYIVELVTYDEDILFRNYQEWKGDGARLRLGIETQEDKGRIWKNQVFEFEF